MSKCDFETECNGSGQCCLKCNELCFCNHVCKMLDENATKTELKNIMENCDWYKK